MTRQQLFEQIQKKQSYLCVGLDTDLGKIPPHLLSTEDPIAVSDEGGRLSLDPSRLSGIEANLVVIAAGYVVQPLKAPWKGGILRLHPARSIRIRCVDPSGAGISGVKVVAGAVPISVEVARSTAERSRPVGKLGGISSAVTGEDGFAILEGLPRSAVFARAVHPDLVPVDESNWDDVPSDIAEKAIVLVRPYFAVLLIVGDESISVVTTSRGEEDYSTEGFALTALRKAVQARFPDCKVACVTPRDQSRAKAIRPVKLLLRDRGNVDLQPEFVALSDVAVHTVLLGSAPDRPATIRALFRVLNPDGTEAPVSAISIHRDRMRDRDQLQDRGTFRVDCGSFVSLPPGAYSLGRRDTALPSQFVAASFSLKEPDQVVELRLKRRMVRVAIELVDSSDEGFQPDRFKFAALESADESPQWTTVDRGESLLLPFGTPIDLRISAIGYERSSTKTSIDESMIASGLRISLNPLSR